MSECGQKIFKIVTWVVILVLVIVKVVSVGLELHDSDASEKSRYANDPDVLLPVSDIGLGEEKGILDVDTSGIVTNKDSEVQFVFISESGKKEVILFENDNEMGTMHDDGKDGDSVPNDGIYTLKTIITGENAGEDLRYYAKADKDYKSNEISIKVYSEPTEQDVLDVQSTAEFITSLEDQYKVDGYVDETRYDEFENAVIDGVSNYAVEKGIGILEIKKTDNNSIYILFDSGIPYVYTIKKEGDEEGGEEAYLSVSVLEPYLSSGSGDLASLPTFVGSAQLIDDTLDGAIFNLNQSDYDVTFDNIQNAFKPNSFIMWHGHGGYTEKTGSFLGTGEMASTLQRAGFSIDVLITGRLVVTGEGRLAITYKYFNKNIESLENSFVYLGGCHTGQDRNLMSVMIWKGASVSVGFTDSVKTWYDCSIMKRMTEKLCAIDESTGEYYPICKALGTCVSEFGENDGDDTPARVIYMGDEDYRIDDLIPAKWNPDVDVETPDIDTITKDVQSGIDKKIDDKKDAIINDISNRIQKAIDDWIEEACSEC